MDVLHANWSGGVLHLWAERGDLFAAGGSLARGPAPQDHPAAAGAEDLRRRLEGLTPLAAQLASSELVLRLPVIEAGDGVRVFPSARQARQLGAPAGNGERRLAPIRVETSCARPEETLALLEAVAEGADREDSGLLLSASVQYALRTAAVAEHTVAQQRVVPMLSHESTGELYGSWRPWLGDEAAQERLEHLLEAMPASFRAAQDEFAHDAWAILDDMLWRLTDARCRRALSRQQMDETVEGRDLTDLHVAWLAGLLDGEHRVHASGRARQELMRGVRQWIGRLEERGASSDWRLCLRLDEPIDVSTAPGMHAPPKELRWSISFHLQALDALDVLVDAADVWLLPADGVNVRGHRLDSPQELLLGELARAARIYRPLEQALKEAEPIEIEVETRQAYEFLREVRPALLEQGFSVLAPDWWESSRSRLGAKLLIDSAPAGPPGDGDARSAATPQLGLSELVGYHWEIAVGDATLTLHEFEQLAAQRSPLMLINGRWVEVRPEDVQSAIRFIRENPGGEMRLGDALRLAYGSDARQTGVPIIGLEAGGWLGAMLGRDGGEALPIVEPPESFVGTLRPYQVRGMSWMRFMERFGFGVCLADDMGLGKTIQLLALLALEREDLSEGDRGEGPAGIPTVAPTLLVAPTSVLGNWMRETRRFTPRLRAYVHHGPERLVGAAFEERALASDLVITSYALAHRDRESFEAVKWRRIVLDEAQFIKNPQAKQTQAVRNLAADSRLALTGTPVENRLSELWSIMDFLNPGYLGTSTHFRTRFGIPIERHRDEARLEKLKGLVRPFILRRLKTDPTVVSDLPEKIESREYCFLTPEQAELYENTVRRMLTEVEGAEGMHRRGLVLSALIKLKQICNHPAQMLRDHDLRGPTAPLVSRSGKCVRLVEQLQEVLDEGEQSLIFTQFRQMGLLLQQMLRHELDRDILFLHGGTSRTQREEIVADFQRADGTKPVLLLSLRAGGVGLNLTAATHVFHFDRWWNPAVENQATDRAYRIGQTRTVIVHKYLVRGTLEERIDEMIEQKTELAQNIIGSGERWLTELDTDDLRDMLTLRRDAIGEEL